MASMVLVAALAAAASARPVTSQAVAPPPVVAIPLASPPPIISVSSSGGYDRSNVTVRIRALAGNAVLLDDRFRVGKSWASFNQSRSEAADERCPPSFSQSTRRSLLIMLRPEGSRADGYRLNASWTRPTAGCEAQGTRSVSIDQAVRLTTGETSVVEGDGGFRVELTRL